MTTTLDLAHHSPGLADGWARFDGPAGTNALGTITDVSGITAAAEFLLTRRVGRCRSRSEVRPHG